MAAKPKFPISHARQLSNKRGDRVQIVVEMMISGQWRSGRSSYELARQWGYCVDTVDSISAEASRCIRRSLGPHRDQAERWLAAHEHLYQAALAADNLDVAARVAGVALKILMPIALEAANTRPGEALQGQALIDRAQALIADHRAQEAAQAEELDAQMATDPDASRL